MKYIRTKDEIFETSKLNIISLDNNIIQFQKNISENTILIINTYDVLKQADVVEELCDEFDWKWNEKEFPYSIARQHVRYSGYGDLIRAIREEETCGKYLNQDYEIYGAIYTNKGLIYKVKAKSILPNCEIDWEL